MDYQVYPINHLPQTIHVGVQTDQDTTVIGFDMRPWMDAFPDMVYMVMPTRPGETDAYPANDQMMVGTVLYWHPDGYDTAIAGAGKVEIAGIGDHQRKCSGFVATDIRVSSLVSTKGAGSDTPPWYEEILKAAKDIKEIGEALKASSPDWYIIRLAYEGGKWTVDRTYAEIQKAMNDEKTPVVLGKSGKIYQYSTINNGTIVFSHAYHPGAVPANQYGLWQESVKISADDVVELGTMTPVNTPNPFALTIKQGGNTYAYNGKNAVTVDLQDAVYLVTVSVSDNGGYVSDRTRAEINAAVESGAAVLLRMGDSVYTYSGSYAFTRTIYDTYAGVVYHDRIVVEADGTASFISFGPDAVVPTDAQLKAGYLRWDGREYRPVSVDEVKAELGMGGGSAPVVILPETVLTLNQYGQAHIFDQLSAFPEVGGTCSVTYNGAAYDCPVVSAQIGEIAVVALGNTAAADLGAGNESAPFVVALYPCAIDNGEVVSYGACVPMDGATSITLSIVQTEGGSASASGSGGVCVINVTCEGERDPDTGKYYNAAMDKTYGEIKACYDAGGILICRLAYTSGEATNVKYEFPLDNCIAGIVFYFRISNTLGNIANMIFISPDGIDVTFD